MNVEKIIALVTAAGIELTDRRRNAKGDGWSLSFANGAGVEVGDDGKVSTAGKGGDAVARLLDLPASGA
jgi:hypothetical protein